MVDPALMQIPNRLSSACCRPHGTIENQRRTNGRSAEITHRVDLKGGQSVSKRQHCYPLTRLRAFIPPFEDRVRKVGGAAPFFLIAWIRLRSTHSLRSLLAVFAVGLLVGIGTSPAFGQFGVAGGLNFESAGDIQATNSSATLDNSTGYHVGLVYEFTIGPVGIRPGAFYRRVGTFEVSGLSLEDPRYTVSAWEVPVDVRYTFLPTPLISPYVVGGPKATFPRGEGDFDVALNDVAYTLNVGVGANISLPGLSWRLQPELRYEFGASGFIDEESEVELGDQNVTFDPQDSPRFSNIALRLHLIF